MFFNRIFNPSQLNYYRFMLFGGAALILIGGLIVDMMAETTNWTLITRNIVTAFAFILGGLTFLSRWIRDYLHELFLLVILILSIHISTELHGHRLDTYSVVYALLVMNLLMTSIGKLAYVVVYSLLTSALYLAVAFSLDSPLLHPGLFSMFVVSTLTVSGFLSATMAFAKSRRNQTEAMANVWFDEGSDAMFHGRSDSALAIDVNRRAMELFESEDKDICTQLLSTAFKEAFPGTGLRSLLRAKDQVSQWEGTFLIKTAKENHFWGRAIARRVILSKKNDLMLIRVADVTRQVTHEQALQEAKDEAEASVEVRTRFLANMSHEIRTPMNGVIGMTSLLLETTLDQQQTGYLETIRTSGESLLTIINEILDFSKIDANQVELENQVFDLETCVAEAMDIVAPTATAKNLELLLNYYTPIPRLWIGDATRLRQILVNLLSNAVKFTEEGQVKVSLNYHTKDDEQGDRVRLQFSIEDTGIGITQHQLNKLFDPFTQADASTTRKYGGTGLGLSICKGIVELMGGTITATSKLAKGSSFNFDINLSVTNEHDIESLQTYSGKKAIILDKNEDSGSIIKTYLAAIDIESYSTQDPDEALAKLSNNYDLIVLDHESCSLALAEKLNAKDFACQSKKGVVLALQKVRSVRNSMEILSSTIIRKPLRPRALFDAINLGFNQSEDLRETTAVSTQSIDSPVKGRSFLLAEDNSVNQQVAVQMFKKLGVRLDVVGNGKEAVEMIHQQGYDFVLMDVQMPEIDGLEATQLIRQMESITQPYIIALTANAMAEDKDKCLEAGMDDFLSKPMRLDDIYQVLHTAIERISSRD